MRPAFLLLLAVMAAVLLLAPSVSAQPPPPPPGRNMSHIAFFNDSTCSHHPVIEDRIPFPSSTKCVPEHFRHHNESATFQCTTAANTTTLSLSVYNDTAACDTTAIVSYASTAPAHSCAPITMTVEGRSYTAYGRIRCEDDMVDVESAVGSAVATARKVAAASKEHRAEGLGQLFKGKKLRSGRMFA